MICYVWSRFAALFVADLFWINCKRVKDMIVSSAFILGWFAMHGCSAACGAGIVSNLQTESSLQACVRGPNGLGLAQWMGDRATKFLNRFGNRMCRVEDQLVFIIEELDELGIKGRLFAETNPRRAAALFMHVFERPKHRDARHTEKRCRKAEELYYAQN